MEVMRLDQTLGQSRHVACASGCMSVRTSLEEGIKLHTFAGIFPEQFFTEASRHREAVVAAAQRKVILLDLHHTDKLRGPRFAPISHRMKTVTPTPLPVRK